MSLFRSSTLARTFLLVVLVSCCFGQEHSSSSRSGSTEPRPDSGSISGNVYSNRFFDFTYEFPRDWIPHGEATSKRLEELGEEKLKSVRPETGSPVGRGLYHLLTVFENELRTPGVQSFRSEILSAEDVSFAPGIKTGEDFLLNSLAPLKKLGYQTFSPITPVEIDGVTFYRVDTSRRVSSEITSYQTFFCTMQRRYVLSLAITTENPEATRRLASEVAFHFGPSARGAENYRVNPKGVSKQASAEAAGGTAENPWEVGWIDSGVYRNNYFGLKYRLREGWYVDTRIFKERLTENTGQASDPKKKNFLLLSANEFAPGTPGIRFNPFIVLMVDHSSEYRPTLTAKDYLPKITRMFQAQQVQLMHEGADLKVGNHRFYRADYRRPTGYQAVLCTDWKGYVLTWTFVAQTTNQLEELVKSLNDVSF